MKFVLDIPSAKKESDQVPPCWQVHDFEGRHLIGGLFTGLLLTIIFEQVIRYAYFNGVYNFSFVREIYLLLLIVPAHELVHLLLLPGYRNVSVGVSVKRMIFFVHTADTLTRSRFLIVLLAPLILLSVLPLIILSVFHDPLFGNIALLNLIGSGVDIISAIRISRFPRQSLLKMDGVKLLVKRGV
jgi:hypothetical protein